MVALLMVPLLTLAAFAIDASQWQVGANQLQTAADAGALAGARAAQLYPSTASTQAPTYANNAASANSAFGATVTVPSSDVEFVWYDPTDNSVTLSSWASTYNAIRVTTRATAGRTFSGVVRSGGPVVTRQAVAWIANVNSGSCIKPWALPYTVFYDAVAAATHLTSTVTPTPPSTNPPFRPNLSQAQIAEMDRLTQIGGEIPARTVVLYGPTTVATDFPATASPSSLPATNQWMGYAFNGSAGANYQGDVGGCTQNAAVGANSGTTLPGNNYIECWTVHAIIGGSQQTCNNANYLTDYTCNNGNNGCPSFRTCVYRPESGSTAYADCYNPATYPPTCTGSNCSVSIPAGVPSGVDIYVVWGDGTGTGSSLTSYRQVGQFRLYCMFRNFANKVSGSANTPYPTTVVHETCTIPGGSVYQDLPVGTIVGVLGTVGAPKLGSGVTVGNTPSLGQRLILVH
jgi:Flp pilus assembly protein TadG